MSEHLESYPSHVHQKPVRRNRPELKKNIFPKLNEARERNCLEEFVYLYNFSSCFYQVQVVCKLGKPVYISLQPFIYMLYCYRKDSKQFSVSYDGRKISVKNIYVIIGVQLVSHICITFQIHKAHLTITSHLIISIV